MKRLCYAAAFAAISAATPALAADVGVSINVGEPGFYGRIDIGNVPRPALVYAQPVIIRPAPVGVAVEPMYLRVPPGQVKHWNRYCARYNACGHPVYFVQDRWYKEVYAPRYRREHGDWHERGERDRHGDRDQRGDRHGHRGDRD
ncbi:MAG: hypothetical protein ACYC7B_10705 [Burkholderiales bacterium]